MMFEMFDKFNKNKSNNMQWGVFASGLALGSIIGAGVALLLAPSSGEEVRSMIGEKSSGLKDQISGKVQEMRGEAEQQIGAAKMQADTMYNEPLGNQPF